MLSALEETAITVPAEMSVIAFDTTPPARFTKPPLTTVDYGAQMTGQIAARITLAWLANPDGPPQLVNVPAHLIGQAVAANEVWNDSAYAKTVDKPDGDHHVWVNIRAKRKSHRFSS